MHIVWHDFSSWLTVETSQKTWNWHRHVNKRAQNDSIQQILLTSESRFHSRDGGKHSSNDWIHIDSCHISSLKQDLFWRRCERERETAREVLNDSVWNKYTGDSHANPFCLHIWIRISLNGPGGGKAAGNPAEPWCAGSGVIYHFGGRPRVRSEVVREARAAVSTAGDVEHSSP